MKQSKTVLDQFKMKFLPEWTPEQFKTMEKKIAAHFSFKPMETLHGNYQAMYLGWKAVSDRLGLAYTSSSSYAGYWVCNTQVNNSNHPGYRYIGFAIRSKTLDPYAILWDKDENEILIPL